jgi:hypothetical protein
VDQHEPSDDFCHEAIIAPSISSLGLPLDTLSGTLLRVKRKAQSVASASANDEKHVFIECPV